MDEISLRSIPPRPGEDYSKQYWEQMDELFYQTVGHAERAFRMSLIMNFVVVAAGVVFIAYAALYIWTSGLGMYSTALGGLGVVNLIASFYLVPQRGVQKIVGDLTQIQIFYRTYCAQWENIMDWGRENRDMTLEQLELLNKQLDEHTTKAVVKIEELIGKKDRST